MSSAGESETYACRLTADAPGAIGAVRLWGPAAPTVADRAFRPYSGGPLSRSPMGRLRLGRVGRGLGDEVVAVSIAGDSVSEFEFQGHAGIAATAALCEALVAAGATLVEPDRYAGAHANGPIEADALIALASASTLRAASILLDQAAGALSRAIEAILLGPDDRTTREALLRLLAWGRIGLALRNGFRIVIAGRPNVGKSRLLNALAGYERAIVAPVPGTTRDVVTVRTAFDGFPVELADTAGDRPTVDAIEREGVERARAARRSADLLLLVHDLSEPLDLEDERLAAESPHALRVANKADLPAAWIVPPGAIVVSAATGAGLEELIAAITARLLPEPLAPREPVPFRPEHVEALGQSLAALDAGGDWRMPLERLLRP